MSLWRKPRATHRRSLNLNRARTRQEFFVFRSQSRGISKDFSHFENESLKTVLPLFFSGASPSSFYFFLSSHFFFLLLPSCPLFQCSRFSELVSLLFSRLWRAFSSRTCERQEFSWKSPKTPLLLETTNVRDYSLIVLNSTRSHLEHSYSTE